MAQVGQQIAARITKDSGSGTYTPQQSAGLYPTTGDTTDWAYGYAHYVQGRTTFAYTIEACSQFQPPASKLDQIVSENYEGALYLLEEAEDIQEYLDPRVLPPHIEEMTFNPDGNYTILWQEQNPNAHADIFELEELTDLSIVTDNAELGNSLWTLDGFSLSTSRSYSSSHSYKSRYSDEDVSTMTTVYPVPITNGMTLSFYTWYSIESNWDFAMVEVSTDNRCFDVLETFTGSSDGWQYKTYDLSVYEGKSLYIRFRYTTDTYTQEEGFYIDDISPVADFQTSTTLSSSITETWYEITNRPTGIYYYRIKGHNSDRGWGDFSTLENMEVIGGFYLNLEQFPFYTAEEPTGYTRQQMTGAASAQMMLNYLKWNSTTHPNGPQKIYDNQSWIFDTAKNLNYNPNLSSIDAGGMFQFLNQEFSNEYGYFFNPTFNDTMPGALLRLCCWINFSVPNPKLGHPHHAAALIPINGTYNRWIAVRGIHTDQPCWPPSDVSDLIVYGFWTNDPFFEGIGGTTYKVCDEFLATTWLPLNVAGDPHNENYVAVVEPLPDVDDSLFTYKHVTVGSSSHQFIGPEVHLMKQILNQGYIPRPLRSLVTNKIAYAAQQAVKKVLCSEENLKQLFNQCTIEKTVLVHNHLNKEKDYFIVAFSAPDDTIFAVLVNYNGALKEFSYTEHGSAYLAFLEAGTIFEYHNGSFYYPTAV
jgi:hypothetical protein